MVSKGDYNEPMVRAAHAVLLEVARVLGEYRDDIAVVGGWVPELVMPDSKERHIGTTDVDLALDHRVLGEIGYETIKKLLVKGGYRADDEQPYKFWRDLDVDGKRFSIEVDLLAGEYQGTGRGHRTQKVQDVRARKARGCDLVFDLYTKVTIDGTLPDGRKDTATIRVANIVSFLVMKGMALADRDKAKDSYDIYFCLTNYPGGIDGIAEAISPHLGNGLVREGMLKIREKFQSPEHVGPVGVCDFQEITDREERARIARDASERALALVAKLKLS
jgi:hypothetical protein